MGQLPSILKSLLNGAIGHCRNSLSVTLTYFIFTLGPLTLTKRLELINIILPKIYTQGTVTGKNI